MLTRVAVGRAQVVREIRAAAPLMAALAAPVPARGPWLTTVLNCSAAWHGRGRPVAVAVEPALGERPEGLASLMVRRRGGTTLVTLLGDRAPHPGGRPPARLLARSPQVAELLAAGIVELLTGLRSPWTLRLAGLPLGDPTLAALAARLPTAALRTSRSSALVDGLDQLGSDVFRTRDAAQLERWLPQLLAAEPGRTTRLFVRAAARLHAAIGQLELAVAAGAGRPAAGLLTLVDAADRWPWWAPPGTPGLETRMGTPLVGLTAQGGARPLSPRSGAR